MRDKNGANSDKTNKAIHESEYQGNVGKNNGIPKSKNRLRR